jgi:DNA-binding transcriptional regulator GbsR (MarR family)
VTSGESEFVEEMGQFLASLGMTPMAGRMWGWLLICEPAEQTAGEIAEALHASRGAISGTARLLGNAGLVRRTTRRGDRREYFSAPPEALDSMLANAASLYRQMRQIAERGLVAVADRPRPSRARLQEFHDVMSFVEEEVPRVIGRFLRERKTASATRPHPRAGKTGKKGST